MKARWVARMTVLLSRLSIASALEIEARLEGLVDAVLAPGLPQRFQLGIGRIALQFGVILFDRRQFLSVEAVVAADLRQLRCIRPEQVDVLQLEDVLRGSRERF